ncbi:Ethylene receptor [Saliniradius amylolyticus]|uniref:histidine kinase n=1 Tax=Saliniradius amylolyticus TaxID=2183582 RepID=A0A2S2E2A8_9ALTE|nr:PAS-domain containing protein [Saliniradius amylolyticus]AWL11785.1 Ethylene receptor [Saliniradius amylolyticus]
MFSIWLLTLFALAYLSLLFGVAFWGDRFHRSARQRPIIYSLALGVHCTSWAFFGTVSQTLNYGWAFVPTYAGSIVVFVFGYPLLMRIIRFCQRHNISSLADFIGAQFGQSYSLAALVSIVCLLGVVPYTALQLDALTNSVELLSDGQPQWPGGMSLYVALLLAMFAIIFGTRSLSLTEKRPGLMLAMAFESLVKLAALIAISLFIIYGVFDGFFDMAAKAYDNPTSRRMLQADASYWVYLSHMVLGFCSMLILPRQFHINYVENNGELELNRARWLFPLYLTLMSISVFPIALGGALLQPDTSPDHYVLAIPMLADSPISAIIGFIGGLSAASSMVIVATLALGIMIANNLVTPLWLSLTIKSHHHHRIQPTTLLTVRRLTVLAILGLSYLYSEHVSQRAPLANSGVIAIALMAQLAPAMILNLTTGARSQLAAHLSILTGTLCWLFWVLWPSVQASYYFEETPSDIELADGLFYSLSLNLLVFIIVSLLRGKRQHLQEQPHRALPPSHAVKIGPLLSVTRRVLPAGQQANLEADLDRRNDHYYASQQLIQRAEQLLSAHVGNASARILLSAITEKHQVALDELVGLVEEATQSYQFNHELLRSSVEHIEQGISVVDQHLKLLAWNQRYISLFHYPDGFIRAGLPLGDILRFNAKRGLFGEVDDIEAEVDKRLAYIRQGSSYRYLRRQSDGRYIELQGNPMPGGGFVTTYSDISNYVQTQQALEEAKTHLEARVAERTKALATAKQEADQANQSKTKFLAAAGHDLMQPFNAATLFASMIRQQAPNQAIDELADHLQQSLHNAENLLTSLLDMTKLDSGRLQAHRGAFPLSEVLDPLTREFSLLAEQKSLSLRSIPTSVWVNSDKKLLRRVLQNLLSNALRYTVRGRVILGVRHRNDTVEVQVWDTGPGMTAEQQKVIFNEFQQLNPDNKQGLGLGLTIVERIAELLEHPLTLASIPDSGTRFSLTLPRAYPTKAVQHSRPSEIPDNSRFMNGRRVLIVDNDPQILHAMSQLFKQWGAEAMTASEASQALHLCPQAPDLVMMDYQLDNGVTGLTALEQLQAQWQCSPPCILNSANYDDQVREQAIEAGLAFIHKPIKPGALKRLIKKVLRLE